jgi:hypothetical protein
VADSQRIFEGTGTCRLHRKPQSACSINSCWTAGVATWSLAMGQAPFGTGFWLSFDDADMSLARLLTADSQF